MSYWQKKLLRGHVEAYIYIYIYLEYFVDLLKSGKTVQLGTRVTKTLKKERDFILEKSLRLLLFLSVHIEVVSLKH